MIHERYEVDISRNFLSYAFTSKGSKGDIVKLVEYSEISNGVYNLGFGDKNPLTGLIDDMIVTNNGDSEKVLATVAGTLYSFISFHPTAVVTATGSTLSRTRLYQIGIAKNLERITYDFEIFGLNSNDEWETFAKNRKYGAFLVHKKI